MGKVTSLVMITLIKFWWVFGLASFPAALYSPWIGVPLLLLGGAGFVIKKLLPEKM